MPRRIPDACAVVLCVACVPFAHRIGPMLRAPYWLDESWVADSSKAPLADLPTTTASTPIGWTFLVWLVPPHGQAQRLIPLAFLAGCVVAGYAFGRLLGWPGRAQAVLAGSACAAAALLLPAQQARHDLKQYTADAAVALLLLALLAWAESAWSVRRAVVVGVAVVTGMLVSHAAALVGAAVLAGLLVGAWLARRWAGTLVVTAGCAAAGMALVYALADRRARNPAMAAYWAGWFPAPSALPRYLAERLTELRPAIGIPWALVLLLSATGVVAVARSGRPATATALVLLPVVAVAAGVGHGYPLLDQRTSHFLLVTGAVVAAVGLVFVALALRRFPVAVALVALAVAGFAVANRGSPVPPGDGREDVRAQAAYVAAHRRPGDVVLVNLSGQYGFAYYWSGDRPGFVRGGVAATGWYVRFPAASRIVVAADRDPASVTRAVRAAVALAGSGRIWLVRSHVNAGEARAWESALAGLPVQVIAVGPEPLAVSAGSQS